MIGINSANKNLQRIYSLNRLIAHELTHAVMKANVDYFDYFSSFIKKGMAELTIRIDDKNSKGIKAMAGVLSLTDYSTIKISGMHRSDLRSRLYVLALSCQTDVHSGRRPKQHHEQKNNGHKKRQPLG